MDMRMSLPTFAGVCSCYFHQDWELDDPTAEAVVRRYLRDADPREIELLIAEIDEFLKLEMTDEERQVVLEDLGCEYYPPSDGLTFSKWLHQIRNILNNET
jgi:phenylalanyl-tRNA synthetase beta subunit